MGIAATFTCVLLAILGVFVETAEASNGLGFGDGLALFLCSGIAIVGVLACLGRYSRRLGAGQF